MTVACFVICALSNLCLLCAHFLCRFCKLIEKILLVRFSQQLGVPEQRDPHPISNK